jgi:anaerobic magnesium-protoporphyrin IX monomethyl ester cyclase
MARKFDSTSLSHIAGIAFRNEHGSIIRTSPRQPVRLLDDLPSPNREILDIHKYLRRSSYNRVNALFGKEGAPTASILTARGCPFHCPFCCSGTIFGNQIRFHSAEYVVKELETLIEQYHVEVVHFLDDLFICNAHRIQQMRYLIVERKIQLMFCCLSRVDTFNTQIADDLVAMGVRPCVST